MRALLAVILIALAQIAAPLAHGQTGAKEGLMSRPPLPAPFVWSGVRLVLRLPANLDFSPLKGALSYRVRLAASESLMPVLMETIVQTPGVPLTALADGDYFVRISGIDHSGMEGRDAVARLRVRAHAEAPLPMHAPKPEAPAITPEPNCLVDGLAGVCALFGPMPSLLR